MRQFQKSDSIIRIIPQILSPDLLCTFGAIGHGDEIAIVDVKLPSTAVGKRFHRLDGVMATKIFWGRGERPPTGPLCHKPRAGDGGCR